MTTQFYWLFSILRYVCLQRFLLSSVIIRSHSSFRQRSLYLKRDLSKETFFERENPDNLDSSLETEGRISMLRKSLLGFLVYESTFQNESEVNILEITWNKAPQNFLGCYNNNGFLWAVKFLSHHLFGKKKKKTRLIFNKQYLCEYVKKMWNEWTWCFLNVLIIMRKIM